MRFIDFINSYYGATSIVLALIGIIFGVIKWTEARIDDKKQKRFENYHKLVKELSQPDVPGDHIKLDRQIAVVYELTNFSEYYPVSIRILQGWLRNRDKSMKEFARLYSEMEISVNYMKLSFFFRFFRRGSK